MTILILGSEGFIGGHLVSYFLEKGFIVVGIDLADSPTQKYHYWKVSDSNGYFESIFQQFSVDYCINAAGSGNVSYSVSNPLFDFGSNSFDTIRTLDGIRLLNPFCKYLHISSAAVYGNPSQLPVAESDRLSPLSPYGWHKLIAETICREYFELYKIQVAIIRPFSVYGNGLRKQLLWDICKKLKDSNQVELFGTGLESRDFIHISDLVELIGAVVDGDHFGFEIFNAASGSEVTIARIASIFEEYYDFKKEIKFSGEFRKGDPLNWQASIKKANEIGFAPKKGLNLGIAEYINWFNTL